MAYYSRNMPTIVTYFPPAGQNGFGDLAFGAGIEMKARWQTKNEMFIDQQKREAISKAVVYINGLVAIGGRLALGATSDPQDGEEIRGVGVSPSLDSQQELVKLWL